ncbi:MAG: amylo-alpha-1,6-glucosidase [Alphaproteobacteria bacterium]|nr:MAG: amylo-alpha-1,6-glucosidase [Alphaproteobacteria bacterium]
MAIESVALPKLSLDTAPEGPFYIPATGPASRPRRTLKDGDTFIVVDSHGDIGASPGGTDGLFHGDTRFLSRLELLLNGVQPLLLGSNVRDDNSQLTVDLTNPDIYFDQRLVLPKDTLHVVRTIFLWGDTAYQRLAIRNYGDHVVDLQLTILFDSDFADLFEVRGLHRSKHGLIGHASGAATAVLIYDGLDGKRRQSALNFDPQPAELTQTSASYAIQLSPKAAKAVFLTVGCGIPAPPKPVPFLRGLRAAHRALRRASQNASTVVSSNEIFNEIVCSSMADLCMLMTQTPQGRYPYAGIPWYSTTFGRDGLITALQTLWLDPRIAEGVLRRLAAFQATTYEDASDAQPGKILHEMREGEMAALGEVPFGLYYGSVDATPLFVMLAGLFAERTGDDAIIVELWPAIEAALSWIDGPGDLDGDGFLEYYRATERGLANQGWKDSEDAIFHADGRLAKGPIAVAEVQGYVYCAKQVLARCAERLGWTERARLLKAEADQLAERFDTSFWCPELGTYALALDGDKEPCRVRSSNAGQVLFTGIARFDRAVEVADGLLRPEFFSGWGIRTIANSEARYNPMSYHNGSIWPHDNALIALGLARYDLKRSLERMFAGLFDAATYFEMRRLPELFCGFQRSRGRGPTHYPVACSPQAWASATPFTLIEASLGLQFDPAANEIRLRNPRLPPFLDELVLRNLMLKQSSVDLKVRRHANEVSVEILERRGQIQVSAVLGRTADAAERAHKNG